MRRSFLITSREELREQGLARWGTFDLVTLRDRINASGRSVCEDPLRTTAAPVLVYDISNALAVSVVHLLQTEARNGGPATQTISYAFVTISSNLNYPPKGLRHDVEAQVPRKTMAHPQKHQETPRTTRHRRHQ